MRYDAFISRRAAPCLARRFSYHCTAVHAASQILYAIDAIYFRHRACRYQRQAIILLTTPRHLLLLLNMALLSYAILFSRHAYGPPFRHLRLNTIRCHAMLRC